MSKLHGEKKQANCVSRSPFGLVGMWLVCTAIERLHVCYSRKQILQKTLSNEVLITCQSVSADKSKIKF